MATEIIDNEIFLKTRQSKSEEFRLVFYLLAFLFLFAPYIPVPYAPEVLHDLFSGINYAIVFLSVLLLLFLWSTIFLIYRIYKRTFTVNVLFESVGVPIYIIVLAYFSFPMLAEARIQATVWLNDGREIDEFVNPFLGFKMLDCRQNEADYDVVFIPSNFNVETDFLEFAPRRSEEIGYRRRIDNNWYISNTGSQWNGKFKKCLTQSKSPYN